MAATRLRYGSEIQRLYSGSISTRKADPTDKLNPINMTIKIYRRLLKLSQFLSIRKRLVHKKRKRSVSAHLQTKLLAFYFRDFKLRGKRIINITSVSWTFPSQTDS